ncbi:MAG: hypothetical protein WBX22_16775 [Silvibacterium sp.]
MHLPRGDSPRPKRASQNFVNHGDVLVSLVVRLCEIAALNELRIDRIEVARENRVHIGHLSVLLVYGSTILPVIVMSAVSATSLSEEAAT